MQQNDLFGTHYEIGYRWGNALREHGICLLDQVPFPLTQDRLDFALACLPHYRTHFPSALEELQGVADGQQVLPCLLEGVLFSMYAMPPTARCSCFAVLQEDGVLWGRNSDFLPQLEETNRHVICRFSDSAYDFSGHTTSFLQMEDGVNLHGLIIGLTSVQPDAIRPGLNAGMLLRRMLETCATVEEALDQLRQTPIASAQTFLLADQGGHSALVECCSQQVAVRHASPSVPCLWSVNSFHLPETAPCQGRPADDWAAEARWHTLERVLTQRGPRLTPRECMALLAGQYGFLCQYDRAQGKDTVWSVFCDLPRGALWRAEGNPARVPFQRDQRFPLPSVRP